MENDTDLYQDIILDHWQNPRSGNLDIMPDATITISNDSCGDSSSVGVSHNTNKITSVRALTTGCTICMASSSMMTEIMHDIPAAEAHIYVDALRDMVTSGTVPAALHHTDLAALRGVASYPNRVKCAMLPWLALESALKGIGE